MDIWHTAEVGFNPYRRHKRRPADYALVAIALLITVALVVWAFVG
jgi:energy-coupling factor transporter transmembrane protein EcfT